MRHDPNFNPAYVQPMTSQPMNQIAPQAPQVASMGPAPAGSGSSGGWGGFLSGFGDWLGQNANGLAGIGSIAGALNNASDIRDLGYGVQQHLENMGQNLNDGSQFQGYGVTSGSGANAIQSTVGTDGSISLGVGPNQTQMTNGQTMMNTGQGMLNDASTITGGQSATDWNSFAQNQMGASNGINPNNGPYGQMGRDLYQRGSDLSPNHGWAGATAQDAAQRSMADPSQRQGEIFNQLMNIQNPMLDQQQAQQQAREHAMGRGGVAGSAYGGTAEDAAMAKARAGASNQAAVSAMQQADAERSMYGQMASQYGQLGNSNYSAMSNQQNQLLNNANQSGQLGVQNYSAMADRENQLAGQAAQFGQLGNQTNANANDRAGMLGSLGQNMAQLGMDQSKMAYLPMQMQMELMKLGQGSGAMAQQGQLTGQDYLAQMLLGGTNANINSQKVSSELMGNLYDSMLDNMGGQTNADGTSSSGWGSMFEGLGDLFGFGG